MTTRSVLVVEDDADVRELLQLLLEGEGLSVLTAAHGAAALEVWRQRREEIALIVLDMTMPVMDGGAFLAQREAIPALRKVPTVVVSASGPARTVLSQTNEFLSKPVSAEQLMAAVRRHVPRA